MENSDGSSGSTLARTRVTRRAKRLRGAKTLTVLWTLLVATCVTFSGNVARAATSAATASALPPEIAALSKQYPMTTYHAAHTHSSKANTGSRVPGFKNAATNALNTDYNPNGIWAGYYDDTSPSNLNFVYSDWIVPSLTCDPSHNTVSSVWVGIGSGTSTNPLYQNGIRMDCTSGSAKYYDWYEDYPNGASGQVNYPYNHTINAGDKIVAFAEPTSYGAYLNVEDLSGVTASSFNWMDQVQIYDRGVTPGWADCIVERVTIGSPAAPGDLTNFGAVNFNTDASPSFHKACDVVAGGNDHIISSTSPGLSRVFNAYAWDSVNSWYIAYTDNPSIDGAFNVYWEWYN